MMMNKLIKVAITECLRVNSVITLGAQMVSCCSTSCACRHIWVHLCLHYLHS